MKTFSSHCASPSFHGLIPSNNHTDSGTIHKRNVFKIKQKPPYRTISKKRFCLTAYFISHALINLARQEDLYALSISYICKQYSPSHSRLFCL